MGFDFAAVSAPFRMQPGLRRVAAGSPQLTPQGPGDRALHEKLAVLRRQPDQALLVEPGFDPTAALSAIALQARVEHPDTLLWDGAGHWQARRLGWSVAGEQVEGDGPAEIGACLRALPVSWRPAALIALTFAEDFAVIDGASACIPWLAVCLPSRWAPEDKVGGHFAQVHAPVADNQTLLAASGHLARLVTGTERWERFVWTLTADGSLSQHPRHARPPGWPSHAAAEAVAAAAFLRTEHQTFIPLPEHCQAVFTILVESRPLRAVIDTPEQARRLHDALASMSPAVLAYRGLVDARDRLLAWLSARAGPA